jgi:hypothetical protein
VPRRGSHCQCRCLLSDLCGCLLRWIAARWALPLLALRVGRLAELCRCVRDQVLSLLAVVSLLALQSCGCLLSELCGCLLSLIAARWAMPLLALPVWLIVAAAVPLLALPVWLLAQLCRCSLCPCGCLPSCACRAAAPTAHVWLLAQLCLPRRAAAPTARVWLLAELCRAAARTVPMWVLA